MDDADERRGHRRPWWQFNVVPLFAVLFVLVWLRHLTNLSQLPTILSTLGVLGGWFVLGFFGLYVRAVGRAGAWRRMRLVVYLAIPLVLVSWFAYRSYRQAMAVEYILGRRGLQPMVHYADGISMNMLRRDRDFHRYWGRVVGVHVQSADRGIFRQLARLGSLQSLSCLIEPRQVEHVARMGQLQILELGVRGKADFRPLGQMKKLHTIALYWDLAGEKPSLTSLAGLPVGELNVVGQGSLGDADIETLLSLPLVLLTIEEVQLTVDQEARLRAKGLRLIVR